MVIPRTQIEQDVEYHGVTKPSRGENPVAASSNFFELGHSAALSPVVATIARCRVIHRVARNRKKARRAAVAAQMRDHAFRNRTTDPVSDD